MKHFLIIFSLWLVTSCKQNQYTTKEDTTKEDSKAFTKKYHKLIGKHIKDVEVESFLKALGPDYEYNDYDVVKFYQYENLGFQLNFTKNDTLDLIFFKLDKIDPQIVLPHGIIASSTRGEIEDKLGKPDEYSITTILTAAYYDENLLIKYQSPDSVNLNNKVVHLGVTK